MFFTLNSSELEIMHHPYVCTARSIEIVPRGGRPLKRIYQHTAQKRGSASRIHQHTAPKWRSASKIHQHQPKNWGPLLGTISMDLAVQEKINPCLLYKNVPFGLFIFVQ